MLEFVGRLNRAYGGKLMEELKITKVVDARALCQIHSRLLWSRGDNKAAFDKLLILLQGLPIDQALWREISEHLADVDAHLHNALQHFALGEKVIEQQPWIQIEQQWKSNSDLLKTCLEAAVPIAIADLAWRGGPGPSEIAQAESDADLLASGGDNLIYASGRNGDTAKLFTRLARTLSVMSFMPGGVKFLGTRWQSDLCGKEAPNVRHSEKCEKGQLVTQPNDHRCVETSCIARCLLISRGPECQRETSKS